MHINSGLLIPILALCIPLAVVVGRHIVRPLAEALMRAPGAGKAMADADDARRELQELRDRVDGLEKALSRVEEEQAFQRALQTGEKLPGPGDLSFLPNDANGPHVPLGSQVRASRRK